MSSQEKLTKRSFWRLLPDALIILTVMAAGINLGADYLLPRGKTIFVSALAGSDWNSGSNEESALRTIQAAAERVRPGDSIVVLPGVYHETVHLGRGGDASAPITLRAKIPGSVTLSNTAPAETLQLLDWREASPGIFVARTPWPVYSLRVDGAATYHFRRGSRKDIKDLQALGSAWPASFYEGTSGLLYLYLPGGGPPTDHELLTHRKIPAPREWSNIKSANLWIEAGNVVIEGLKFDFGVGAAIRLWSAPSVTIRDCAFTGAAAGVAGLPRVGPATDLLLERNLYHNYPQYHWRKDVLSWWDVYRFYSGSSLAADVPPGADVRFNLATNFGDGIGVSTGDAEDSPSVRVHGNLLFRGTDDAFEIEGQVRNVFLSGNLVFDSHVSLGLSPVLGGPVVIEGNLFLHPPDGLNGSQLKLLASAPGKGGESPPTIRNIRVSGNTFLGNWLAWWKDTPMENIVIRDNVFRVQNMKSPPFPPAAVVAGNDMALIQAPDFERLSAQWALNRHGNGPGASSFRLPAFGPSWYDLQSSPATRDLVDALPSTLFDP